MVDQSDMATRMVEENTAAGEDVGDFRLQAGDDDSDILTYTLGDTAEDGAFDIEAKPLGRSRRRPS